MSRITVPLVALLAAGGIVHLLAAASFNRRIDRLLNNVGRQTASRRNSELPPIVRTFAERAGASAEHLPETVRLRQRCQIRFAADDDWRTLTAEQVIGVRESAFVWIARQMVGPLTAAKVVDAYVDGKGYLEARALGSIRVAHATGPDADRGELLRYLAELPWAPDAMLHNPSLEWRQLDDETIEVAADSASGRAGLRFTFVDGDLVGATADARPRMEGESSVERPWQGRFWEFRDLGGRRLPTRCEVSWILPDGPLTYFRGEIVAADLS